MAATETVSIRERLRSFGGSSRRSAVLKGTASAALAKVLTTAVSFVSLPLCVRYFGAERYGVWVTILSTSAWLAVFEFGLTDTITNMISAAHAHDDRESAARYATNAVAIAFCFALLLFGIGLLIWPHIDFARLLNVHGAGLPAEVSRTVAVACSLVLLTPMCTVGLKILSGYQQTHVANTATSLGALLSLVGLLIGVSMRASMPVLFLASNGVLTACGVLTLVWTLLISKPWLRPRVQHLSPEIARGLLSTGLPFFLIRLASVVVFSTDNVIVSHYLGAAQVTPYSVAMRVVMYAQLIPAFVFPSLWAAYAEANARGEFDWIRRNYRRTMAISTALTIAPLIVLVFAGRWIIRLWAGPVAVPSEALLLMMAVWAVVSGMTGVQSCLLGAVQRNRLQAIVSLLAAGANLALSIFLVQRFGAIGAVEGTLLSYTLILGPQSFEVRRYFRDQFKRPTAETLTL
ncbi:Membrane protein involved in the export of O-antigen and teichoic acid [Bryocella elongata]|uniref:Membrane protein involved in the export of O-antigen and teichoic acid n=1 Tax=Bryocella elongata TaxID=863522 RepID=A0A1H5SQC7_9BACT|nr:oligosaccharide flippase family protein [Bryocella elongata]SEF52813.1 Membrane protein involved in the export of O-antigen and teichoic acid [Bryocella elongata]